ncbi:MAG: hypothetical protein KAQ62_17745 [Cyclobacteriaceae bacterium]|nr:hypothetical protein [Cyclobacteriaceae bacterium]MCK5210556.1 hypothetical protein [Cyclobacteriaceae bacterium]MCK5279843.1 hypothetical protein [Cyclobacteriaceae bacterium]MCK5370412.1 hypothetical protein [Cyclobacteriaceae bacterium]MCK5703874.1 hypothetical protein [Cyclobacteriaceae bacterium]
MPYRYLLPIILIFIISSCSTVSVQKSKPNPSTASLDRVLIIAMTNQYEARSMYEQELSFRLREKGYNMFSSINVDKSNKDLFTKEEILELIDEKNIDGVITMQLKDITSKERYTTSDRYISDMYNQHNYFFNYIDTYYNVYSWSYQAEQTVVVEANLFDASDKSLIYIIDATIKNAESEEERAGELTKSFAKALDKSGFLKKK